MKVYVLVETTYYKEPRFENTMVISVHKTLKKAKEMKKQAEEVDEILRSGYKSNTSSFYNIIVRNLD